MALTKEKKKEVIESLKDSIDKQKIMVFGGFTGLKAKDLLSLRRDLKSNSSKIIIVKKTLMKRAFDEKKIEVNPEKLEGEAAIIFGFEDQVTPAKTAFDFSKSNSEFKIIGGILDGEFKEAEEIVALAKLPSRDQMIAIFVGTLQAPVSGFANVLQGNIKGLVTVLSKIKN